MSEKLSTGASEVVWVRGKFWHHGAMSQRFLTLADIADALNISAAQTYALVRTGELPAIKIGGRGQWRVEASQLEAYITRMYALTQDFVETHPFGQESAPLQVP